MMQTIIEDFAEDPTERSRLANLVDLGKTFIKQQLDHHVIKENMVNTHGLEYALTNPDKNVPIKDGECNGCIFLPWVVSQIKGTVRRSTFGGADVQQDAWDVLKVCHDK
ncbi:hypothetical protein SARC_01360 [Sphaeroforma arctica JP610]|uniref:Uncharacterized protein n=1 Tax=Sphaeroforma arctica JP610 TaxID=667725 RepID=A0A0L0GC46_9EUKA|nr:hypothetical protein SARC_01360 [Sphaeroforma arctica JP610]KNC86489.1 hypothetical protein SARC_01360 [Sphaeroforma arctica JP610]|eukprot:XP_014160391.1 hypothetical protein SARC_01360 [Sphaeroforma arctica JP610]